LPVPEEAVRRPGRDEDNVARLRDELLLAAA
jgi:hypothetical protein